MRDAGCGDEVVGQRDEARQHARHLDARELRAAAVARRAPPGSCSGSRCTGTDGPGSKASGVRTGKMCVLEVLRSHASIAGGVVGRLEEVDAFGGQQRTQRLRPARRLIVASARARGCGSPRAAARCVSPSIETSSMPARNFFRIVATRTMKNSSRLVPVIARNLTRSSSGCDGSCACASTRWLNSSQLSSRLMYSRGDARSGGSRLAHSDPSRW